MTDIITHGRVHYQKLITLRQMARYDIICTVLHGYEFSSLHVTSWSKWAEATSELSPWGQKPTYLILLTSTSCVVLTPFSMF